MTYIKIKFLFEQKPYLHRIKERYRIALSRLRTNMHILEIERGRTIALKSQSKPNYAQRLVD